jgi:hypothetical protein
MENLFLNIIDNIKGLFLNPKSFWVGKKENLDSRAMLLLQFFIPLVLLTAIAVFLGEFFRSSHFYVGIALLKSARIVVLFVLQYYLATFFTTELMKTFGGEKNREVARNLVIYSFTPFLLVSAVTGLFQFLYVIDVLGFYGFYLFWVGAKEMLVFPDNKKSSYILLTIVVNFFVFSFLSITLSKLLAAFY